MQTKLFDRSNLVLKPLAEREHDLVLSHILKLEPATPSENLVNCMLTVAEQIVRAREKKSSIILMMGAHVLRSCVQPYIIDLMERGLINCLAMNGAGIIHDYELAKIGATTESVSRYIKTGEFGLWKETGYLNDIINAAFQKNPSIGMGEAVGEAITKENPPHKNISLLVAAYRLKIPATIHVGIGYDIIHQHPNCDGAATGALSYNDFLKYARMVQNLENGIVMNFGSSVMAPEVYLKALSMARNVAHQRNLSIKHFSTLVCDLHDLPNDFQNESSKGSSGYYFRPWKTMLVRTVADGGDSFYIKGHHAETLPALWTAINQFAPNTPTSSK